MLNYQNCEKVLLENILPFWTKKMVDKKNGGFYGRIDGNNTLHPEADKCIILNTRILWSFSAAYMKLGNDSFLDLADRSYNYILDHFLDYENSGVYWSVTFDGTVSDRKKQIYAQAFAIYAFTEYFKVSGNHQALQLAKDLFRIVERYSFDVGGNGYLEAFSRKWKLKEDLRLSEKDANEAKTMNTHLHILEAYTNLYKVWKDESLADKLENLIHLFLTKFIDDTGHFHLFFDEKWKLKSDLISYGHDIEGAWLILESARVLGNEELIEKCKEISIRMTKAAMEGLDEDGGLMNEGGLSGVMDTDKHWWVQAEALVGLNNAWILSGIDQYRDAAEKVWSFIASNLIDNEQGEWHWMVHRDGSVNPEKDKAGPWKGPYHNTRAMLELMKRLKEAEI